MEGNSRIVQLEDYERYIGAQGVERIFGKVKQVQDLHVVNVSSTYYGGGVATLLSSLSILLNSVGLETGWRVIQGAPDFFSVTKKMHNALQGGKINLSEMKKKVYEQIIYENVVRNHIESHDVVVIHDPQPLGMIGHYPHHSPWIWRCHVDMTNPDPQLWEYLRPTIERYDAVVFSCKEYKQKLGTPQVIFMPAIDPFSITNR